jgi:hypothetical protein
MSRAHMSGLFLLLIGSVCFVTLGVSWGRISFVSMIDFKAVYCGARAVIEHKDPYNQTDMNRIYLTETGSSKDVPVLKGLAIRYIYPPTTLALTLPFGLIPWGPAHVLWMTCTAASFILAAFLIWSISAANGPVIAGFLVGLLLMTSELLVEVGNSAGIAVSLCVIAVCCFVQRRFLLLGVFFFAMALLVKPHDALLVWVYFLLAGREYRKSALQTLLVSVLLALPFVVWVSAISPHWFHEMSSQLAAHTVPGGDSDPRPAGILLGTHGAQLVNLQTAFGIFWSDPRIYDSPTYLVCGVMLVAWFTALRRSRPTQASTWFALASAAAISMLPNYHRQQDTRILLLMIPAFALLWVKRSALRWAALIVTLGGVLFTGDIPLQMLGMRSKALSESTTGFANQLQILLLGRTATLALVAVAVFYLYAFLRQTTLDSKIAAGSTSRPSGPGGSPDNAGEPSVSIANS